jgi:hypothetical protein
MLLSRSILITMSVSLLSHHAQKQTIHRTNPLAPSNRQTVKPGAEAYLKHALLILSIFITPLNACAAVSETDTLLHPYIRSDLADRGTPRDAPEPDSHCKRTQHLRPSLTPSAQAPNGNIAAPPNAFGEARRAPMHKLLRGMPIAKKQKSFVSFLQKRNTLLS